MNSKDKQKSSHTTVLYSMGGSNVCVLVGRLPSQKDVVGYLCNSRQP